MKKSELLKIVQSFKGKNATLKKAKVIAANLPPSIAIDEISVLGSKLIKDGIYKDEDGFEINPAIEYKKYQRIKIDSVRLIGLAFKKNGEIGVKAWLMEFMKNHVNIQQNFPQFLSSEGIVIDLPSKKK